MQNNIHHPHSNLCFTLSVLGMASTKYFEVAVKGRVYDTCPSHGYTLVSEEHIVFVAENNLYWTPNGYVDIRFKDDDGKRCHKTLHRFILEDLENKIIPTNKVVHHIDGDRWNNTLGNLEITTQAHNIAAVPRKTETSTSQYHGVGLSSDKKTWQAYIKTSNGATH